MEKTYEYLLIGATFWSVGFAAAVKGRCMIVESKMRIGYEFIDAFRVGMQDRSCVTEQGRAFRTELRDRGIIRENALPLQQACAPVLCNILKKNGTEVLFATEVTGIKKTENEYRISLFGPSGLSLVSAGCVIDTTSRSDSARRHCTQKWISAMLYADCRDALPYENGYRIIPGEREELAYLKVPVPVDATWDQARSKLYELLRRREEPLKGYRLISVSSVFCYDYDYEAPDNARPSDSFPCFLTAFDNGALAGKEHDRGSVSVI